MSDPYKLPKYTIAVLSKVANRMVTAVQLVLVGEESDSGIDTDDSYIRGEDNSN